ncbi:MAG: S26 family signal peptidase [Euryarchaeota archaeon]|nr:S26 family signal peptidase [Euryarchaeota archaeon]
MSGSIKKEGKETIKDIIISIVVVAVVFLALYAYAGVWPPIVVVESGSMQHGNDSNIGTIDTGDIVVVKKVYSPDDVTTYIEGRMSGYKTYGNYGDVLIYNYNGMSIIHRAIAYLMWDGHEWKIRGVNENHLPNWLYIDRTPGQEMLTIYNVTMSDNSGKYMIMIHLDPKHLNPNVVGDEGFITMGDHNLIEFGPTAYDQNGADGYTPICPKLVSYNMITGVARGELPWFGAIKLYLTGTNTNEIPANTNLWLGVSIVTLVAASFLIDYAVDHRRELWEKLKKLIRREEESEE